MVFGHFREKMRQTTKISSDGVHFKSTDNARVDKTVKEAEAFGKKLQHMKKHLLSYHTTTEKLLVEVQSTVAGELPMVHDMDDATGKTVAHSQPNNAEQSLNHTGFAALSTTAERNLQQALAPIDRWLAALDQLKVKTKTLDNHRLEFDEARRHHNRADLERVRQQQKHDLVDEVTQNKVTEKEGELNVKRDQWSQFEHQVHSELAELLSEAGTMHTHLAAALRAEADHLTSAISSGGGAGYTQQMGGMNLNDQPSYGSAALSGGKPMPAY